MFDLIFGVIKKSNSGFSFGRLLEQRENGLELYPGMELGQSAVTNGTRVLITNPVSFMNRKINL